MSNFGNDWRDTEFGEGQERYYGDLSQQPTPADTTAEAPAGGEPNRASGGRGKGPLIAVAGVAVVALAAGGAFVATRGGDADPDSQAQGSSAASPNEPTPSARMPRESGQATADQKPLVSGWQVNDGNNEFPLVFDVPPQSKTFKAASGSTKPEWEIVTESGKAYGFSHPRTRLPLAMTDYAATYRSGNCATSPTNALAFVGFTETSGDAVSAAGDVSRKFLRAMSLKENGTDRVKYSEGTAKTVKVNNGKTSAVQVRTDVPWSRSDNSFCSRHERELVVTSVPTSSGTGTIVASHVKDPKQGVDTKTFDKILKSIRPRG